LRPSRIVLLAALGALVVVAAAGAMTPPKVDGAVGPGFTIGLKSTAGKKITALKHGSYTFVVSDKADIHSFHLTGPGVNKVITGVGFKGTKTVTLVLKPGTYKFFCDVHPTEMHGSFKVS
jgi:hypothetical protein